MKNYVVLYHNSSGELRIDANNPTLQDALRVVKNHGGVILKEVEIDEISHDQCLTQPAPSVGE